MAIATGTKLGPYELLDVVGAGGMGEVYRARDPRLGRDVAVKVLPASFSADTSRLRRFEQEARAAAALNHPNILAVYDVGTQDGNPYIVSELLEGETLRARLRAGALPVRKALEYALQMARGLAAAHDKGIAHRDLKPENVFITRDGRLKILDFGLAKLAPAHEASDQTAPTAMVHSDIGTVLGTVGYMSPEQVRGKPADARSDLFSFGAIVYEMVSGTRAFKGETAAETMSAILKEEPPELSATNTQIPLALDRLVRHCLEKNPEERFQSARDVAFDLEMLSSISSQTVTPPPVEAGKRRLWPWALTLGVLAVAALAFVLGRTSVRPPESPRYRQATFRRGYLTSARFAPDGETIVYTASWDGGRPEVYSTRAATQGSLAIGLPNTEVAGLSKSGEMAVITNARQLVGWVQIGTLGRTQMTGGAPRAMLDDVAAAAWAPDGSNLAVARYLGGRFRLEFPLGKVLYDTSGWISHVRFSPKGDTIAFIDHPVLGDDRGTVAIVDLAGNEKTVSTGFASVQGLAWSVGGDEIWFTGSDSGVNTALYATTPKQAQRVIMRTPGRLILEDIARDGRVLLSREAPRRAMMMVRPGESRERDMSLLDWSVGGDISRDGQYLLFSEEGDGGGPNYSVYLRKTDGSPAVRLGDGQGLALSPDGKWALTSLPTSPAQLYLLPTGAGEARQLTNDSIHHVSAAWLPDGQHVVFTGVERGKPTRTYLQDIKGGKPLEIGPGKNEGLTIAVSPDGKSIVVEDENQQFWIQPIAGGPPVRIPGMQDGDLPVIWAKDGESLLITHLGPPPARIERLNFRTGKRELFKEYMPSDPAGIGSMGPLQVTPDGQHCVYGFTRILSELYVAEGLK